MAENRNIRALIRALAPLESPDALIVSVYIDVRPEATGESPAVRAGLVMLEDRLRQIGRTLPVRGEARDSYDAEVARINEFVDERMRRQAEGLAIFACQAIGLFETVEAGVPFEQQVSGGERVDLYQLARLDDEFEAAVVAVVDTNTARIFIRRFGTLREVGGPDDDPVHYQKRSTGGWSEARYQRHIDNHRRDFTKEIALAIHDAAQRASAKHIILAGDEVALPRVLEQLPRETADGVVATTRADIRVNRDQISEEVEAILQAVEDEAGKTQVERLVAEVRSGRLGIFGVAGTRLALERGQADVLVIDDAGGLDPATREEFVRLAAETDASVEVVDGSEAMRELDGVGAILRYRI